MERTRIPLSAHVLYGWVWICWLVLVVSTAGTYVGKLMTWENPYRLAVLTLSIPLMVASVIVTPLFHLALRAGIKDIAHLVTREGHWVHWVYSQSEWESHFEFELTIARKSATRRALKIWPWLLVWVIGSGLMGGLRSLLVFLEAMASIILVGFMLAFLTLYLPPLASLLYRRNGPREVYIGPKGLYYGGLFTAWNQPLTQVNARVANRGRSILVFGFRVGMLRRYRRRPRLISVPIPDEKHVEAVAVVGAMSGDSVDAWRT